MSGDQGLLTTVGTSDYESTTFEFTDGTRAEAHISPIALIHLLDIRSVYIAHTSAVRTETNYLDEIQAACTEHDINVTCIEIPLAEGQSEVDQILDRVERYLIQSSVESLVLDMSHAFRSLQFAFYTTATHLDAIETVSLDAIYYARDAGHGGVAPVVDLTYLATLMEWQHALRSINNEGTLGPIQEIVATKKDEIYRAGERDATLLKLDKALSSVAFSLDAGLPLETGIAARDACEFLSSLDESDFIGPEGAFIAPLAERLERFAVRQSDVREKAEVQLTIEELHRQRRLVELYLGTRREWIAIECARELFLSRYIYEQHGGEVAWLNKNVRHGSREALTKTATQYRSRANSPPLALSVWERLSQFRNMYAHAGFQIDSTPSRQKLQPTIQMVCDRLPDETFWRPLCTAAQDN